MTFSSDLTIVATGDPIVAMTAALLVSNVTVSNTCPVISGTCSVAPARYDYKRLDRGLPLS